MSFAAGLMTSRARFERRGVAGDDGYGNVLEGWTSLAVLSCAIKPNFGGENDEAGRPQSTWLGVLTLHRSGLAGALRPEDRAVVTAGPYKDSVLAIRSIVVRPDNATIECAIECGVAT